MKFKVGQIIKMAEDCCGISRGEKCSVLFHMTRGELVVEGPKNYCNHYENWELVEPTIDDLDAKLDAILDEPLTLENIRFMFHLAPATIVLEEGHHQDTKGE